jgi:prevent-host-death family protein
MTMMTIMTIMSLEEVLMGEHSKVWTVADAKAHLSQVIERARARGPQVITRNGKKTAVVVSAEEWERKTKRQGNLAEFFASSPLRASGLEVKRRKDPARKLDL